MILQLHHGDCLEVLKALPPDSVHAVISDPPYGFEFMALDGYTLSDLDANVGRATNSGFGSGASSQFKPAASLPNYGASANLKCKRCNRWLWSPEATKCQCEEPDLPNFKGLQNRAIEKWHQGWLTECFRVLKPGGVIKAFSSSKAFHRLGTALALTGFRVVGMEVWAYGSGFPKNLDVAHAIENYHRGLQGLERTQALDPVTDPKGLVFSGYGTAVKGAWEPFMVGRKP